MRRSFGAWLGTVFLLSIVLPLLILAAIITANFDRMYARETDRLFVNTLYGISQSISVYLNDLAGLSMMPYFQADIMRYYIDMNQGEYLSDQRTQTSINKNYQLAVSQQLSNVRQDVSGILFTPYNTEHNYAFLVRRYSGELEVLHAFNAWEEDWFQGAADADGYLYFPPIREPEYYETQRSTSFFTDADYRIFSVARLIKHPDTQRPVGVLKVDVVNRVLVDLFRHITLGPYSALALLDQANQIIYATSDIGPSLMEAMTDGPAQPVQTADGTYYVSSYPVASTPWTLYYLASSRDMQANTRGIYVLAAAWGIVSLGIAAFLFYLNSRSTVRAERDILTAMTRLAAGDLTVRLSLPKNSHYATIAGTLNQTMDKLNAHITSEYKAVLHQRNAEYIALQAQVNPHFLYNILSGFITLNRIGEKDLLETLLLKLSLLFRYACVQENTSTVSAELTFLEEYLALQRLRFMDRLVYSIHCAPAVADCVLPRLLLQPLVENAIVHGVEPLGRPVRLEVTAEEITAGDGSLWLMLCVWDDAEGFDTRMQATGRIGLANVEERLQLFEAGAFCALRSSPGAGCRCVLLLPLHREGRREATCAS